MTPPSQKKTRSKQDLLDQIDQLEVRLFECEETLTAIRRGEVDAIVVSDTSGEQVYTLNTAERIYRTIIEEMNEAAVTMSESGTILFCNSAFAGLVRLEQEHIVGSSFLGFVPSEDRDLFETMLRQAQSQGARWETSFVTAEGGRVPVLLSMNRLDGARPIMSLLATDLRDQKRNERIVSAGKLAGTILESVGEAVIVCEHGGTITHTSRIATDFCGEFPRNKKFDSLFDIRTLGWTAGKLSRVRFADMMNRKFQRMEAKFLRKDGQEFDLLLSSVPLTDEWGERIGLVVTMVDITSRKAMEQDLVRTKDQLLDTNMSLENKVLQRTSELEQANKAKDQFLANMSHEIRTPMAGVLGLTEILLHQELPAKMQDDLEMIRSSADSVMNLINDLFDLSRINQGKFEYHPKEFNLRSMVRDAIRPFEFQAHSRDLDFTFSIDDSVPSQILCDKDRLGQVIKNLVSNAFKFTDQGYVRVYVQADKNDEDTLRLNFAVADSGMGIPKNKQKEVFSAFTQLDPSYSKKFAGMGLGLAISKCLVEGMGGKISVESARGKGATFSFYVICGIVTDEQELTASSITLHDLPPITILIAEDNAINRLFLRRALVTAGHKVGEAENGKHALAKLKDNHFDLVLMDIQMPEMDGVEAARRIRTGKHGRADIPIIALTAYAMKGDREKFIAEGMNGYVTKPVDFGELSRTIAEVCGISVKDGLSSG